VRHQKEFDTYLRTSKVLNLRSQNVSRCQNFVSLNGNAAEGAFPYSELLGFETAASVCCLPESMGLTCNLLNNGFHYRIHPVQLWHLPCIHRNASAAVLATLGTACCKPCVR